VKSSWKLDEVLLHIVKDTSVHSKKPGDFSKSFTPVTTES
jgi:hypothetical protein